MDDQQNLPENSGKLADRLHRERAASFVGRETEIDAFRELLEPDPPFRLLLINGTSGAGKTTLLQAFWRMATASGVPAALVDARDLPAEPAELAQALDRRRPALQAGPAVVMLDSFERLAPHERWLREIFLPSLPDDFRVVIAGRWEPATAWRTDPGWASLMRSCRLTDFSRDETRRYLDGQGLPVSRLDCIQAVTRGHPLAVSLVGSLLAEDPDRTLDLEAVPEVVQALVGRHLDEAPDEISRQALYAASLVRNLHEPVLAAMLALDDARETFDWLQRQGFMEPGPRGFHLHDLVGEALRVELKQRQPHLYRKLIRRAADYLVEQVASEHSEAAIQDFLFTLREYPPIREVFVVEQDTGMVTDRPGQGELAILADMIEQYEGPESRGWFEFWAARQPEEIIVLRDESGQPAGINFYIDITEPDEAALADPAVAVTRTYLDRWAPLRSGECAHLCRFVMARGDYQSPSPAMTQLESWCAFRPFQRPELTFQATVRREDQRARTNAQQTRVPPLEGCTFRIDGRDYFVMGHDWRTELPKEWLRNLAEQMLSSRPDGQVESSQPAVPDRATFGAAVEAALKAYARGADPTDNPLAQSCLARSSSRGRGDPTKAINEEIDAAVGELEASPQTEVLGRVLRRTYLNPAAKQRAAADAVGLSYGTYRRRLREALRVLTDRLWERELEVVRHGRG